jgi:cyclic pyranopterin phosphate synthase
VRSVGTGGAATPAAPDRGSPDAELDELRAALLALAVRREQAAVVRCEARASQVAFGALMRKIALAAATGLLVTTSITSAAAMVLGERTPPQRAVNDLLDRLGYPEPSPPEAKRRRPHGPGTPLYPGAMDRQLSHLDEAGRARMVDVGGKAVTDRRAIAGAVVRMSPATAAAVARGDAPKGDVVSTARIAGIQAAKRTAELIPLCHPLPLSFVDVAVAIDATAGLVTLTAEARTSGQTGVEMEAMTAVSAAALTVYDMVKGVERGVEIAEVALLSKSGGRHDWRRN